MHPQMPAAFYRSLTIRSAARQRQRQTTATILKKNLMMNQKIDPGAELPPGEFAALLGLDWGDKSHAIALQSRGADCVEFQELEHSAESLHAWLDQLRERFAGQRVAVALEASKGAIVAALLEHSWLVIYPVHPAT